MRQTLAYLGPEGSFSAQAANMYAKNITSSLLELQAYTTIPAIFEALARNKASLAIVPSENSIEGSVTATMDLLVKDPPLYIRGEMILPIQHHLLGPATDLSQITQVLSHPQALAQCREYLEKHLPEASLVATNSTAEAARLVAQGGPIQGNQAAISTLECSSIYQLSVLATDIADYANNETRFLLIGREPLVLPPDTDMDINSSGNPPYKTSLIIDLKKDQPGGLYQVLGLFARENINLTRIESRPSKTALGKYLFFIDCEASTNHSGLKSVLSELELLTASCRNLGSYLTLVN